MSDIQASVNAHRQYLEDKKLRRKFVYESEQCYYCNASAEHEIGTVFHKRAGRLHPIEAELFPVIRVCLPCGKKNLAALDSHNAKWEGKGLSWQRSVEFQRIINPANL